MRRLTLFAMLVTMLTIATREACATSIDDFNTWTEVEDPADPGLTASLDSASQVTLSANGMVPANTDIGYQSVDGTDVLNSTQGHYFSASESFHVGIDFNVSTMNSMGLAGIGFGIGEDGGGANSAGVGLAIANGIPSAFSGAARISDMTQSPILFGPAATASGRFFVRYDHTNGDVIFGVSTTPGDAMPTDVDEYSMIQNSWNGDDLLVSFFLRSDMFILPPLSSGMVDIVFSNFEVLEGTPIAVPEPASTAMALMVLMLVMGSSRPPAPAPAWWL